MESEQNGSSETGFFRNIIQGAEVSDIFGC